jgi:hypothetical protein
LFLGPSVPVDLTVGMSPIGKAVGGILAFHQWNIKRNKESVYFILVLTLFPIAWGQIGPLFFEDI